MMLLMILLLFVNPLFIRILVPYIVQSRPGGVDQVGYTGCVVEVDIVPTLYRQWSNW